MENKITNYIEYLFAIALQKCENIHDAEDLTQEVILASLSFEKRGGVIDNPKSWLSSTLNHKFNDSLRRKYNLPTISIDEVSDTVEEIEQDETIPDEAVRREIAYLAKLQREVIVKHYLQGKKVQTIADELGVPKGTVLSRLSAGREQMRKGFDEMEQYEKQSYNPERLDICCHGRQGFREEPWSLVENDLMKQNILIVAYEKPVSVTEIARALGIPTPFVENAVNDLIRSELMKKNGSKVFTDFIILSPDDLLKGLDTQIEFAESNYGFILSFIKDYLARLRKVEFYKDIPQNKAEKLEYFFVLHLLSKAIYTAVQRIVPSKEDYPPRPDGGAWIADGRKYPLDFDFDNFKYGKYCYGGMRGTFWENIMGARSFDLKVYDTQPALNRYNHGPVEISDDDLAKMLYLISRGIQFGIIGFDEIYLKDVPHLVECGILGSGNGKVYVDIPMLRPKEYEELEKICIEYMRLFADFLEPKLREIFGKLKTEIPKHLEGRVAEFRQYSCYAIPMAFIKRAAERDDIEFVKSTPPMVFVVDDDYDGIR